MSDGALRSTDLPLQLLRRGKVRDVYEVDASRVLLVTTDRISAFDVVMNEPIPMKGVVLTQLSAWWFRQLESLAGEGVRHHMISADINEIVAELPQLAPYRAMLNGRTMLAHRVEIIPVECVIRGYITGSAWKEYKTQGTLAGEALPAGLLESDRLVPPIFSPATKAESGHDMNITVAEVEALVGKATAQQLELLARRVYEFGRARAEPRGIIVADTKFEFGRFGDGLLLADEVLTPDSSRFWPADSWQPGRGQPSFDKQPLRDWLDVERNAGRWNGDAPPPTLPPEVVEATSARYQDAFFRVTGVQLASVLSQAVSS